MQKTLLFPRAILGSASVVLGLSVLAGPAFAGFEWVPAGSQQAQAPVVQPAPAASVQQTTPLDSMPYVTVEPAPPVAQIQTPPPESSGASGLMQGPGAPERYLSLPSGMTEEAAMSAKTSAPAASMTGEDKPLRGFANNIPLTVALRQILPASHTYSLAKDVEPGTLVSWHGGASWRQTLTSMLAANSLSMQEDGGKIKVTRIGSKERAAAKDLAQAEPAALTPMATPPMEDMGKPMALTGASSSTLDQQLAAMGGESKPMIEMDPAAPTPAPMMPMGGTWTAERGDTLRKTLEKWGKSANIEVVWQAEYDYPLQTSVVLSGSFEEAARSILEGFQEAQPQPIGSLHNSQSAGGAVLVVQTRGNNYGD